MKARRAPTIAALMLVAMILLGFAVGAGWAESIDRTVSAALVLRVEVVDPALVTFMQAVSWIGGGIPRWIIVILLCGLVWHWCGSRCAVALGGASLLANLASSLLKRGFSHPRPDLIEHLDQQSSFAYPSGHATSAAAVYLLLAWLAPPRWRPWAWALAGAMILLNALSRIMLGVHWASDVVGGTLLGAAFALLGAWWVGARDRNPVAAN